MTRVASRPIRPIVGHGRLMAAMLLCLAAGATVVVAQDASPAAAPAQVSPSLQPSAMPQAPVIPATLAPTATQRPAPGFSPAPQLVAPPAAPLPAPTSSASPAASDRPAPAPGEPALPSEMPTSAKPDLAAPSFSSQSEPTGTPVAAPQQDAVMPAPAIAAAPLPPVHDLSPWGMFLGADPVVKGVMVLLAAASVATWTILLFKFVELAFARRRMKRAMKIMSAATSLVDLSGRLRTGVASRIVEAAIAESERSVGLPAEGIKERVMLGLVRLEMAVGRRMMIGTGLLATIGSTGPFVGLFGTVWGIMRSFIGIANSNTTNLAVVAPGIAEALLATGIGLVAAIPAVVIYNILVRSIGGYRQLVSDASTEVICHLSRDLDRRRYPGAALSPSMQQQAAE